MRSIQARFDGHLLPSRLSLIGRDWNCGIFAQAFEFQRRFGAVYPRMRLMTDNGRSCDWLFDRSLGTAGSSLWSNRQFQGPSSEISSEVRSSAVLPPTMSCSLLPLSFLSPSFLFLSFFLSFSASLASLFSRLTCLSQRRAQLKPCPPDACPGYPINYSAQLLSLSRRQALSLDGAVAPLHHPPPPFLLFLTVFVLITEL